MCVTIRNSVGELVRVAYACIHVAKNSGVDLTREVEGLISWARSTYDLERLKEDRIIRAYRDFYWRVVKVDPTKQRPSQEALLRRTLRGEFPRVNPLVDIGNIASVKYLIPIGLYDLGKVGGRELDLRYAREGEVFHPIGYSPRRLSSNQIVLALGDLILHVYPYRDSELTKVDESTRDVLAVAAGVPGVEDDRLISVVEEIARLCTRYLGSPEQVEVRLA